MRQMARATRAFIVRSQVTFGVRRIHKKLTRGWMRHWHLWHLALMWLALILLTCGLVAIDVWRVGEFAISIPGRPSFWRIGAFLRAAAPVLPVAAVALVVGPLAIVICTIWWIVAHVRGN